MIEGILGKKIGMTHVFAEDGTEVPVTVIKTDPCHVVQRKVNERDGYEAVQLGMGEKKEQRTTKPLRGHFKKAGTPCLYNLVEFECSSEDDYKPGQVINCSDIFKVGDFVDVSGTSKGKGFQGAIKRWGFSRGPQSHGSGHGRAPGSIGQSSDPSRVFKGMKLPGHQGNKRITVQNIKVVEISPEENILLLKGAIPGSVNSLVQIKKAIKK
jgi:large subunit ribosomal protein L3